MIKQTVITRGIMSAGRSGRKQFDWEELGCIIIINDNHVQHLIYKVFSSTVCHLVHATSAAAKSRQSCPTLCDPQMAAHQASPSLGFSKQEHWSGLPFPSPMHESKVAQSCPTLSDPMDCSLIGSSVHGIFQARVLEWGAIAFSGGNSR